MQILLTLRSFSADQVGIVMDGYEISSVAERNVSDRQFLTAD